jgi:hypothetical protein
MRTAASELHETRLDAHDRRFTRMEMTLTRLVDSITSQSLMMGGVDRKLSSIVHALGCEDTGEVAVGG